MSVLNFFKTKTDPKNSATMTSFEAINGHSPIPSQRGDSENKSNENTNIPESVFIEYAKPERKEMEATESKSTVNDLQVLYKYLEQNLERKGYEDALVNPDTNYMEEHVQYITNELSLLISKVRTYYSGYIRIIDFHIETRKRSGMVETVDELLAHKQTVLEEIGIVSSIHEDSINKVGLSQNLVLSYKRGFRNGFAAITYNTVLGRKK